MKIKLFDELIAADLPPDGFAIVHSAWLAVMDVRENGDLDLILSPDLRAKLFPNADDTRTQGLPGPFERRIRFHPANSPYGTFYGAKDIDDVIAHYCLVIDGVRFVEPRFYFMYKRHRLEMLRSRARKRTPYHRLLGPLSKSNRVLQKKIQRDVRELVQIDQYLDTNRHRSGRLADIEDDAWDSTERLWLPDQLRTGSTIKK